MAAEAIRECIAAYLIVTLAATAFAKLSTWRSTSVGLVRESVIPTTVAPVIVFVVSSAELVFGTLIMLRIAVPVVGYTVAAFFVILAAYRLTVTARTNFLMCSCTGTQEIQLATRRSLAGAVTALLIQSGLAVSWALLANASASAAFEPLAVVAWLTPIALIVVGILRRRSPGGSAHGPYQPGEVSGI